MAYEVTILTGGYSAQGVGGGIVVGSTPFQDNFFTQGQANFFAYWVPGAPGTPTQGPFPAPQSPNCLSNSGNPSRVNRNLFASAFGENGLTVALDVSTPACTPFRTADPITNLPFSMNWPVDINENNLVLLQNGQVYSLDHATHTATLEAAASAPQEIIAATGIQEYDYRGLNDIGDVVGVGVGAVGSGLFYSGGTLYTVPGCALCDINNSRLAVGTRSAEGTDPLGNTYPCSVDFSGAGAPPSEATLIPFEGMATPPISESAPPLAPMAVNNNGVVVGSVVADEGRENTGRSIFPFIYFSGQPGAKAQNLNSLASIPGYTLATACDIDDSGQIVGMAHGPDGDSYPYIATPVPPAHTGPIEHKFPTLQQLEDLINDKFGPGGERG